MGIQDSKIDEIGVELEIFDNNRADKSSMCMDSSRVDSSVLGAWIEFGKYFLRCRSLPAVRWSTSLQSALRIDASRHTGAIPLIFLRWLTNSRSTLMK